MEGTFIFAHSFRDFSQQFLSCPFFLEVVVRHHGGEGGHGGANLFYLMAAREVKGQDKV